MDISAKAISKIAERYLLEHPEELKKFRKEGRLLFVDIKNMPTDEILKKLKEIGLIIDRESMEQRVFQYYSAYKLAMDLMEEEGIEFKNNSDDDFFWMSLTVLWERWFPELINIEMLDDMMQEGYDLCDQGEMETGIQKWWMTWQGIKDIMDRFEINHISSFDTIFRGTQSVFNWSSDFDHVLSNEMFNNQQYAKMRIDFCTEYIERYGNKNELNIKNMQVGIAEAYFYNGQRDKGLKILKHSIQSDPEFIGGWVTWADCCQVEGNLEKAVEILNQGLGSIKEPEDRLIILERLENIYAKLNLPAKNEEINSLIKEEKN